MSSEFEFLWTASDEVQPPVSAPAWPAYVVALAVLVSAVALLLGVNDLTSAVVGYLSGALLAPAFTIAYRFGRRSAASSPFFIPRPRVERAVHALVVLGILAGVGNAWFIATELAKQ